jgi:hypothetical protein
MKHIKYYLITMILCCLIVAGCNESVKHETQSPIETADSAAANAAELTFAAPMGNAEYDMMRKSAFYAFSYPDTIQMGYFRYPEFIEPKINLIDFQNYINTGNYEGIRIYPGYDMDQKHLVFIICLANRINGIEANYTVLPLEDYSKSKTLAGHGNLNSVQQYHDNYFRRVRILFQDQNRPDATLAGKLRFSRFYERSEIKELIDDNLKGIPGPYDEYTIQLEFGYIAGEFVSLLQDRIRAAEYTNDQMQGFTAIMYLRDHNGNPMIHKDSIYRKPADNQSNDYKNLYLEVGSPCPPLCGELHMD